MRAHRVLLQAVTRVVLPKDLPAGFSCMLMDERTRSVASVAVVDDKGHMVINGMRNDDGGMSFEAAEGASFSSYGGWL